jgi:hypothetical protein
MSSRRKEAAMKASNVSARRRRAPLDAAVHVAAVAALVGHG